MMPDEPSEATIQAYLAGRLSPEEIAEFELLLAGNPQLQQRVRAMRLDMNQADHTRAFADATSVEPPKPALEGEQTISDSSSAQERDDDAPESSLVAPAPASVTLADFTHQLTSAGLLTPSELEAIQRRATPEGIHDAETLVEALIRSQLITPYQVEILRQGGARGLVLGNYVILDKLGEGGMGLVFRARHRRMKRVVALKLLPPALTQSADAIARFHREVEAAAKLSHPNIAAAYDADESDGVHFMVMEYVDGPNLSAYVRRFGPLPPAAAVMLCIQAARGLAHAHAQGVIHRDIKPGNLLIGPDGTLKILDMGLARMQHEAVQYQETHELTQSGRVMGTVDYMAPEQALDAKRADQRADIYSLGCTLYFLLTGHPVAPDATLTNKLLWHQNGAPPRLSDACKEVPEELEAAYQQMLAKRPEDRQATMDEVITQLEHCLSLLPHRPIDLPWMGAEAGPVPPTTDRVLHFGSPTIADSGSSAPRDATKSLVAMPRTRRMPRLLLIAAALLMLVGAAAAIALFAPGPFAASPVATLPMPVENQPSENIPPTASDDPATVAVNGGNTSAPFEVLPGVTESPYRALLAWVFASGGTATIVSGEGSAPREIRRVEEIPATPFEIRAVRLEGASVVDDELYRLAQAPGLRELSLARVRIGDDGLAQLRPLKQLASLDLTQTNVTNEGLRHVAVLEQLRELRLAKTAITDQGLGYLARLPRLERLYLSDTRIGDAGIRLLEPLRSLRHISLTGVYLSDEGYDALRAALPQVEIAWDGRDVERATAHRLLDLGAELSLVTRSGQIVDAAARRTDLPRERFSVTAVNLEANPAVTDDDLTVLATLPQLESLRLGGTSISHAGLAHLQGLMSLKTLDLGALQLSKTSVDALQNALPDCEVVFRPSSDAVAARWVLERGGKVIVAMPDGAVLPELTDAAALPRGEFTLRSVDLEGQTDLGDEDLANLKDLPHLQSLFLTRTNVGDSGLLHLSGCTALQELSLSYSKATVDGVLRITRLPALTQLYVAGMAIDGQGLQKLASAGERLTHLSLAETPLADADLVHLRAFPRLWWLSLSRTGIGDAALPHLARLAELQVLYVDGTRLSDAGILELKAALARCEVQHSPLNVDRQAARWVLGQGGSVLIESGEVLQPADLPRGACTLRGINLEEVVSLDREQFARVLPLCRNLEELTLSQTPVGDAEMPALANLASLRRLYLASTNVSSAGIAHLTGLKRLELLDLRGTRVNDEAIVHFIQLPQLRSLYLGQCRITDRGMAPLAQLADLTALDLGSNADISDRGVAALAPLSALETLVLRGTRITNAAMETIAAMEQLRHLDLSSTEIGNDAVEKLKTLRRLETLLLYRTRIEDASTSVLAEMKSLKSLNLEGTRVTPAAVESLRRALPECQVRSPQVRARPEDEFVPPAGEHFPDAGVPPRRPFR